MAGTMPHAIFVETGLDGGTTVAAYAAELPGCATFAADDSEAVAAIPRRVLHFSEWLRRNEEAAPAFVGDNWYEVERAACDGTPLGRAAFSLDELPPSEEEWQRWLRWLELAREELAEAIDRAGVELLSGDPAMNARTESAMADRGHCRHPDVRRPGRSSDACRIRCRSARVGNCPSSPGTARSARC